MAKLSVELQRYFLADVADSSAEHIPTESFSSQLSVRDSDLVTQPKEVTLDEILSIAGERTFGFLFVLLSLPSALPIPAPGYSTPFGILMFLLATQLIVGREQPWFPEKFRKQGFERSQVQSVVKKGVPWLQKIEMVARPRLTPVCTSRTGQMVIGIAIALMSISMMIPIPLTNTLPAIGIFVTGFGLLDDDGAISLAGLTVCAISAATTTTILFLVFRLGRAGMEQVVEAAKDWVKP
ncbi:Exopolysaccharide synthesis, ExoD superfamily [Synechococcus sp. PCC 7335]|uniref:exopolysaccharide biosynthesis protein n=1 Tax=Synechococcus sp. (strain ATCC 29403 / PCC 7335) TaxID=91464 RepID=UPI00017EB4D1|nr:exopolysaccharide biosynthesis protein [Synechococcus sp. PCC 7335]EDX86833.1 Exopolysaccharide synthesis, ExoD superfamily [Synechococcus sp. PCC 7335]